jgi:predicted nucleic acid-binding protein
MSRVGPVATLRPPSSPAALLCDTGALLDYLVVTAPDHRAFREAIDRSRTRYVPGLVLAEVDYFLRQERRAMGALMRDLSRGAFTYAAPTLTILDRAMEIDRQYADLGLGLVDASVVALAEELGVYRLATRDVRHFSAVRLRGGKGFELVVQPRRPDRGA